MYYTTVLFAALLGSTYTSARPGSTHVLSTRQVPNVPSQCRSICDPPLTTIDNSCSPQQCCTATFETQFFNCLVCIGAVFNTTDYSTDQMVLNELQQNCSSLGLGIPTLTLPGQGGNSSSSPSSSSVTNSSSLTSTRLPTLSVPPLPSTISQTTVTSDSRTTAAPLPTLTATEGNGTPTMGAHVSFVCAVVVGFVTVAIEYLSSGGWL